MGTETRNPADVLSEYFGVEKEDPI